MQISGCHCAAGVCVDGTHGSALGVDLLFSGRSFCPWIRYQCRVAGRASVECSGGNVTLEFQLGNLGVVGEICKHKGTDRLMLEACAVTLHKYT